MRQKLGLVAALQHDPDLLVLDEPTSGLDPLVREDVFDLLAEAARAGRTVLHSSHVLSEVERTCSRVAILREGRLVSLRSTAELRRAAVRRMEVRFSAPVEEAELLVSGVEILEREGASFVLRVSGPLDPLLAVLARRPVEHLAFPEPSLEEAFVEHYRKEGGVS
jgi:ABC-2 type transport system ATP-binding protein